MRIINYFAIAVLFWIPASAQSDEGRQLFDKYCISCHSIEGAPQTAPPIFGVINHVKAVYPEREAFVERVVAWVNNPNPYDVLMPGAARRFGVMPKLGYPTEDVRKIAEFLYEHRTDLPQWYIKHYRQEHGKNPTQ